MVKMFKNRMKALAAVWYRKGLEQEEGIDGILVTVGLCIIALLLCVVMKDSLAGFVTTIVTELTKEAKSILSGVSGAGMLF